MDDDCNCGKTKQRDVAHPEAEPHKHDMTTARGLKPDDLHGRIQNKGFRNTGTLASADGRQKVTIWRRPTPLRAMGHNDTLITLEIGGEVQLFRLSEVRPLEPILSGKMSPA